MENQATFKLNGKIYRYTDVMDKDIYANTYSGSNVYILPDQTQANFAGKIKAGSLIGNVYSYIERPSVSWLMVENRFKNAQGTKFFQKKYIYVPVENVSYKDLTQSGVKTLEEIIKEKEEEKKDTIGEKIFDLVKKFGIAAIIIWGGVQVFKNSKFSK